MKRGSVDSPRHLRERDSGIFCSICHNGEETQRSCSPARCNTTRQARSMVWRPSTRRSRNVTARPASDKREGYFILRLVSCTEDPQNRIQRRCGSHDGIATPDQTPLGVTCTGSTEGKHSHSHARSVAAELSESESVGTRDQTAVILVRELTRGGQIKSPKHR